MFRTSSWRIADAVYCAVDELLGTQNITFRRRVEIFGTLGADTSRHKGLEIFAGRFSLASEKPKHGINVCRIVVLQTEICAMATIRIVFGQRNHSCPDRVEMNVTDKLA
jgi:hypothetical protein